MRRVVVSVCALALMCAFAATLSAESKRSVLIRASKPYDGLIAAIERSGGSVTHKFKYVNGLAAEIPESAVAHIERLVGPGNLGRDEIIPLPATHHPKTGLPNEVSAEAEWILSADTVQLGAEQSPANYAYDRTLNGLDPLAAAGYTGSGIIVAIIDSGYRPQFNHVAPTRIIGPGFSFVPDEPDAIHPDNAPHGTQVAGFVAAQTGFCVAATSRWVQVAQFYGQTVPHPWCAPNPAIFLTGSAPAARIVPLKIFPAGGGGSPTSRTIQAMEKVIELREKFEAGEADGINIRVLNMSLGGPTSAAARTLSDQTIEAVINHDIVPVISAGNDGFSSVTGGSPGTSFAALTVGAASTPIHERIVVPILAGSPCATAASGPAPACAQAYRPDDNIQIVEFSSRGPTHDGRIDPDVIANGTFGFTQGSGASNNLNWASGTSFSAPAVAGIAAVLRQAAPDATARQIRNAIFMTADPSRVPTAAPNDQGAGFVNAAAALALLQTGTVPDSYATAHFTRNLPANMSRAGMTVYEGAVSLSFSGVRPAEVTDVPFIVPANTQTLHVRLHGITAALPPAQQNVFFGDDVFIRVQSAAVHRRDRRVAGQFVAVGQERVYTFTRPEAGVWRITPTGDWTNAGTVSYSVDVWTDQESWPQHTAKAKISFGETHAYQIEVPAGTLSLDARLSWMNMYGNYPISDVDVILTPPTGPVVNSCNTGRAPELCAVANPVPGTWTATVVGFSIPTFGTPGGREDYTLRIAADGVVIAPKP